VQLLDSDWPANILSGSHFRAQENELMSPDSVCTISVGPAWHDTSHIQVCHEIRRSHKIIQALNCSHLAVTSDKMKWKGEYQNI